MCRLLGALFWGLSAWPLHWLNQGAKRYLHWYTGWYRQHFWTPVDLQRAEQQAARWAVLFEEHQEPTK